MTPALPWSTLWPGLLTTLALATGVWLASLWRHDLSLIDRWWGPMVAGSGLAVWLAAPQLAVGAGARAAWAAAGLALAGVWALRLSIYLSWRNWGRGEDRRYTRLREAGGPGYAWTSWLRVFVLQAVLAWLISAPLMALAHAAALAPAQAVPAGAAGAAFLLALAGLGFEAVADAQMASFRRWRSSRTAAGAVEAVPPVMDRGLWRYSRHPNYFGEACFWWGLGGVALAVGGVAVSWALLGPALLTFLLLKVSGAPLLEADLGARSPAYRDYIARTPAFVPGPPHRRGLDRSVSSRP